VWFLAQPSPTPTATVFRFTLQAKQIARRADMACVVEGPVLRELCCTLFTHPNMQRAFHIRSNRRTV